MCLLIWVIVYSFEGSSTLIAAVYLLFVIYTSGSKRSTRCMRIFNIIVIFIVVSFQFPAFPCPANLDIDSDGDGVPEETRFFVAAKECDSLRSRNSSLTYNQVYGENSLHALYMLFIETIGMQKLYVKGLFINRSSALLLICFLVIEIQEKIVNSAIYTEWVLMYRKRVENPNKKLLAFRFVEEYHLNRFWKYKKIQVSKDAFHFKMKRMIQRIQSI